MLGEGNQYRYILVKSKDDFPKTYIKKLMKEAYVNSLAKAKDKKHIMRSVEAHGAIEGPEIGLQRGALIGLWMSRCGGENSGPGAK